jgi:hypothetical protein
MTEHCIQICREVPFTWNRLHDQGAEWVGPQLSDENDATVVKPVEVTWLQRRMNGLWFGIENEDPEVPGGVEEEYEWVRGYQEREMEMDGERWRRCKYRY